MERESTQVIYLGTGESPETAKLIPVSEALERVASAVADEAFRHWCRLMEKYESAAYLADTRAQEMRAAQQDARTLMRLYGEELEAARRTEKVNDLIEDAMAHQLNAACGMAMDFGMLQARARGKCYESVNGKVLDLARYGL